MRGLRLNAGTKAVRSFPYTVPANGSTVEVPMVLCHAVYDSSAGRIVLLMTNRHRTGTASVQCNLSNFTASENHFHRISVSSATTPESMTCYRLDTQFSLSTSSNPVLTFTLLPASVSAIVIQGN